MRANPLMTWVRVTFPDYSPPPLPVAAMPAFPPPGPQRAAYLIRYGHPPQAKPEKARRERRAVRVAAAPGHATRSQLAARWTYYGGKCWLCGRPATMFDHVKPLAHGGSNWPANQRPACWPCNRRKGQQWPYRSL